MPSKSLLFYALKGAEKRFKVLFLKKKKVFSDTSMLMASGLLFVLIVSIILLSKSVMILNEYERAVVFRLGRASPTQGPELIFLLPFIDAVKRIDLRTVTLEIDPQDVITRDNVTLKVDAVLYFQVIDAQKAVISIENYLFATLKLAQTTLRSVLGHIELDDLLTSRDTVNHQIENFLAEQIGSWGIRVASIEIKQIDLPSEMQRAMAKQAEAERERRATLIAADAERQASQCLLEAAQVMAQSPISIQLRYLQTLREMATERSSHTLIPFPLELLTPFLKPQVQAQEKHS